jgi:hypothetical protein
LACAVLILLWFLSPGSTKNEQSCVDVSERVVRMQKTLKVLNVFEDSNSGAQVFQIHEQDPDYKIDRIVYREKSPYGWFKEITSEDYLRKVKHLRPIVY